MAPSYLSMRDLIAKFRVSRCTIYNWIRHRGFPAGTLFTARCRRWSEEELKAFEYSLENRKENAAGRKALEDQRRASHLGGASTGKRAKDFWDEVFNNRFKPSGLTPKDFATRHCKECAEEPLARTYANGKTKVFTHKTIENEMNLRLRE